MADFCKQCSLEMFNNDYRELANLCTKEDNDRGLFAVAICEGCGSVQVDCDGTCVSNDCMHRHGQE